MSGPWSTGWAAPGAQAGLVEAGRAELLAARSAAHRKEPWREARRQAEQLCELSSRSHPRTSGHPVMCHLFESNLFWDCPQWHSPRKGVGRIPSETREHTLTSAAEQWRRREADFLKSSIHNIHNPDHSYTENIKQKLEVKRSLGKPSDEGGPKEKPNAEDVILGLALQREDHHFKRSALTNTDVRDTGLFL